MKSTLFFVSAVIMLSSVSNAAQVSVLPQTRYSASLNTKETRTSFAGKGTNLNGFVNIVNGDGTDMIATVCTGNIVQRLVCTLGNVVKLVVVELQRPSSVEIYLNNQLIANSASLGQEKGKLTVAVKVNSQNELRVRLRGSPTAYLTVQVTSDTAAVNLLPLARISLSPNTGIAPELISLSGLLSSDSDGSISSYVWDFGDGSSLSGAMVLHQYLSPGTYVVKLTVTDNQGGIGTATQSLLIKANQIPLVQFISTNKTALGEMLVSFDASSSTDSDGSITEYKWNFGDGSPEIVGTGTSIVLLDHLYSNPGNYDVSLSLKDNKNGVAVLSKSIAVFDILSPALTITTPASDAVIINSPVAVQGFANEKLSEVSAQISGDASISLTLSSDKMSFSGNIQMSGSGMKILAVSAKDLAGNSKVVSINLNIQLQDLMPPILLSILPGDGSTAKGPTISVLGVANEVLSEAKLAPTVGNAIPLVLSSNGKSFSGSITTSLKGLQSYTLSFKDLAGNQTTSPMQIFINGSDFWSYSECPLDGGQ